MKEKINSVLERSSVVITIIGIAVAVFALAQLGYRTATEKTISIGSRLDSLNAEIKYQKALEDIERTKADIEKVKAVFSDIAKEAPGEAGQLELSVFKERVRVVEERVSGLEAAINASPSKALAIPILRKDFDYLVKDGENQRAIFRAEIDKIYEQQKWITNGIITVLLLIIGSGAALLVRIWLKGSEVASD